MRRAILAGVLLASFTKAQQPTNMFSPERELALGTELSSQAQSQYTLVRAAGASAYIERIGRRLIAALPEHGVAYRFAIVEDRLGGSTNEPVSLPGGSIFIPANLVAESRNESELAGMIAHAIAHVAARHATRLATRAEVENVQIVPAVYLDSSLLRTGDTRLQDLQRGFESEADRIAVAMLAAVGYDPTAFATYIARQQQDGDRQGGLWPARDERVQAIRRGIDQVPQSDFGRVQEELRKQ